LRKRGIEPRSSRPQRDVLTVKLLARASHARRRAIDGGIRYIKRRASFGKKGRSVPMRHGGRGNVDVAAGVDPPAVRFAAFGSSFRLETWSTPDLYCVRQSHPKEVRHCATLCGHHKTSRMLPQTDIRMAYGANLRGRLCYSAAQHKKRILGTRDISSLGSGLNATHLLMLYFFMQINFFEDIVSSESDQKLKHRVAFSHSFFALRCILWHPIGRACVHVPLRDRFEEPQFLRICLFEASMDVQNTRNNS
jgi:hypothetical protein